MLSSFNFFGSILCISVVMAVTVTNAVYAILFLILAFFSTMCLLFLLKLDYLALLFILIYVGAITILFLFVVMMLKIKLLSKTITRSLTLIKLLICFILIYKILGIDFTSFLTNSIFYENWFTTLNHIDNIIGLGQVLFGINFFYVILAGLILLVGIMSSILLTKDNTKVLRRYQLIFQQISHKSDLTVFNVKPSLLG